MVVTRVVVTAASDRDLRTGLLGYIAIDLGGLLRLDGLAVRRTRDGRMTISYPSRTGMDGTRHPILRPLDAEARKQIEDTILGVLETELVPTR